MSQNHLVYGLLYWPLFQIIAIYITQVIATYTDNFSIKMFIANSIYGILQSLAEKNCRPNIAMGVR